MKNFLRLPLTTCGAGRADEKPHGRSHPYVATDTRWPAALVAAQGAPLPDLRPEEVREAKAVAEAVVRFVASSSIGSAEIHCPDLHTHSVRASARADSDCFRPIAATSDHQTGSGLAQTHNDCCPLQGRRILRKISGDPFRSTDQCLKNCLQALS